MYRKLLLTFTTICITLLLASVGWSNAPAPPANQQIGIDDGIFNNLVEDDCRACHDDPDFICSTPNVDRHHLMYGLPLPQGECSVNGNVCLSDGDCNSGICSSTNNICACGDDSECPETDTCLASGVCEGLDPCVDGSGCPLSGTCVTSGVSCSVDGDCPGNASGETCGEVCIGETAAPFIDANQDGINDTTYGCLNCHGVIGTDPIEFGVERDCTVCHIQFPGEASIHHLSTTAQGIDSPLGDPAVGDCTPCHGTLVDDIGDGHRIPTYDPSMVTPEPSAGVCNDSPSTDCNEDSDCPTGTCNALTGGCNYCHSSGTGDPNAPGTDIDTGTLVYGNEATHHNTGVFLSETGVVNDTACTWCHQFPDPIRTCEGCHGLESLHNIQADSDGDDVIEVGGEDYAGYGHIGRDNGPFDSDCWGCHGFSISAAPNSGPITPSISSSDAIVMIAGTDTTVNLTGAAFTNLAGTTQWVSDVLLTATDGSSVTLTPDSITQGALAVTIPGTTATGNYILQAVKDDNAVSNPVVISIKPEVVITDVSYNGDIVTITGSGFGDTPPEGAEEYINVEVDGVPADVSSWTDTEIVASVAFSYGAFSYQASASGGTVTVNSMFCNDTYGSSGSCEECLCDANNDCTVDLDDLVIMRDEFLDSTCAITPCQADCNGDGNVDLFDLLILNNEYLKDNCCP